VPPAEFGVGLGGPSKAIGVVGRAGPDVGQSAGPEWRQALASGRRPAGPPPRRRPSSAHRHRPQFAEPHGLPDTTQASGHEAALRPAPGSALRGQLGPRRVRVCSARVARQVSVCPAGVSARPARRRAAGPHL